MQTLAKRCKYRGTALALAIVYVWLSAILPLSHTDDLRNFATVTPSHAAASIAAVKPLAPEGPCLACEWSGIVHAASAPVASVAYEHSALAAVADRVPTVLHLHCFDDRFLRGPPSSLA
jgi:hypothetical protein